MSTKKLLLDTAEVLDAFRIFPRLGLAFLIYFLWDVHEFITAIDNPTWVSELYAPIVWGGITWLGDIYIKSGRKWE